MVRSEAGKILIELKGKGLIAKDAEIVSIHNNLVVRSLEEETVARIGKISDIENREDPADLRYSHRIARMLGERAFVLAPMHEYPSQYGDLILSTFPMLSEVDWAGVNGVSINEVLEVFGGSLEDVERDIELRELDVAKYSHDRIASLEGTPIQDSREYEYVTQLLINHQVRCPFSELKDDDPALTHGDFHHGNILSTKKGELRIIDLDSVSRGPRLYDIASWRVRGVRGDVAPTKEAVDLARNSSYWNEEAYLALIGWKILSSMTHVLRYEKIEQEVEAGIRELGRTAGKLGVLDAHLDWIEP